MLSALSVRDIVLIDRLDLVFAPGMTVLTGETGAGKSILLDALALALGGRGDQGLVRKDCENGQVTAEFAIAADHPIADLLTDNAIDNSETLVLRRIQYADGRTRAFINDQAVSASLLRTIGTLLVEIHGQHADRALVDPATHRRLLDAFGGLEDAADKLAAAHGVLQDAEAAVHEQKARVDRAASEEEFARHVVAELEDLAPEPDEEDQLATRRQALMALEKASDDVREIDEVLAGPQAPGPALAVLLRRLTRKGEAAANLFAPVAGQVDAALVALDEAAEALEAIKREMDFDPHELERTEERLFALRAAARKHGVDCAALPDVLARYQAELAALESGEEKLVALTAEAEAATNRYRALAAKLSAARAKTATSLGKAVEKELPDLKLGGAKFTVGLDSDETRISAHGFDLVGFEVQTNPGTAAGPLMKVASGGELSRFLLALKVVLADRGSAPVLIFDEIDTGVGGAVADAMGRRLARLAAGVQVLSVTHAPQVAARATHHLLIEKHPLAKADSVRTGVAQLDPEGRQDELARMLAGANVTDEARAAAGRLLAEVK